MKITFHSYGMMLLPKEGYPFRRLSYFNAFYPLLYVVPSSLSKNNVSFTRLKEQQWDVVSQFTLPIATCFF